ncbi:MAG: glycerophosphodiester phosphodiesterase family protein [Solirubrobacterales bacterium]
MRSAGAARTAGAMIVGIVVALACASTALASPYVHAHRGGPLKTVRGELRPAYPENSLPAFRHAAKKGFVLEMDTRMTADGRAVIMHDASLKRTTTCTGLVSDRTLAEIRRDCEIDILGTDEVSRHLGRRDDRRAKVPTMVQALALAKRKGVGVNLEVNNYPTDPDYDPTSGFVTAMAQQIEQSGFPPSDLILQSFLPGNLTPFQADAYFDAVEYSYLSFQSTNGVAAAIADASGFDYISPQWPVSRELISEAHAKGLQVVPFTFDERAPVRKATRSGADALIANDPAVARRAAKAVEPDPPPVPRAPSKRACAGLRADNLARPVVNLHPAKGAPRVFALQYKQDLTNVVSYRSFRRKIECMIRDYVVPHLAGKRPNVVALNEDVGLMTLATGSRGAETREIFSDPGNIPGCEGIPSPCGVAVALGTLDAAYASQESAYADRFDGVPGFSQAFVAGTDTFARGWMQTFSDLARRYGVYILGSNNQAEFRESVDPAEIDEFADPDVKDPQSAFVATGPEVYNEAFMWGPENVTPDGPRPLRNVVASNKKVPLTDIENLISLTPGPSTGPDAIENVRPYRIPGTKARMSFATSLPAFVYDGGPVTPFGEAPGPGIDPCSDTSSYYMYCLDALGANVVMQDEANPGLWATPGEWQPLEWMSSTWRAVADPTVRFDYNVTPHMVGNLADLVFDGQTAITQRGLKGPRGVKPAKASCNYVGNDRFLPEDPAPYEVYAGPKREFLGLAPWAAPDGPRSELRAIGAALAPGSGDARENDYLETAVVADLPFPPVPRRDNCR